MDFHWDRKRRSVSANTFWGPVKAAHSVTHPNTICERQLIAALASTGRKVSSNGLLTWRRNGLLPPLEDHGLGYGKGKYYGWDEPNIVAQASVVFDLQKRYSRNDAVVRMLWLQGYQVQHTQLRRAWSHYATPGKSRCRFRQTDRPRLAPSSNMLLQAALSVGDALHAENSREEALVAGIIELLFARLAPPGQNAPDGRELRRSWWLIDTLSRSLETSDLLADAGEDDLAATQRILCTTARLVQSCADDLSADHPADDHRLWNERLAERIGPPLFFLVLFEVRSGAESQLGRLLGISKLAGRRDYFTPAQPAYTFA